MKDYIPYTIKKSFGGFTVKITQMLNPRFNIGHYNYYIENSSDDIVRSGYSTGAPQDKIGESFVDEIFNTFQRDR